MFLSTRAILPWIIFVCVHNEIMPGISHFESKAVPVKNSGTMERDEASKLQLNEEAGGYKEEALIFGR